MPGKFNIQRARGTLPGVAPSVRASIDVTTGGRDIARAVSGLGEAMADVGMRFYLMEADTQLEKARMQADEEHVRYMLGLRDIEDTSAESDLYKKAFDASMKTRRTYMPKNKLAARGYESYLTRNTARWGLDTAKTKMAKQKDNFKAVGFELQQKGIESGNYLNYFTHLEKGRKLGFYTDEEVERLKADTQRKAERRTAEEFAMRNPDALLRIIKGDKIQGYENLTPGDVIDIRSIAIGQQNYNENRIDSAKNTELETIWDAAVKDQWNPQEAAKQIDAMQYLTPQEKAIQLRNFMSISNLVNEHRGNPYLVRQKPDEFFKMLMRLEDDPTRVSIEELREGTGKSWTVADYQYFRKFLLDSPTGILRSPLANEWHKVIDAEYLNEKKDIRKDEIGEWFEMRMVVDSIIEENWGQPRKIQAEIEALVEGITGRKINEQYQQIETWPFRGFSFGGYPTAKPLSVEELAKKEPRTFDQFWTVVNKLENAEEARKYYEKWKNKW